MQVHVPSVVLLGRFALLATAHKPGHSPLHLSLRKESSLLQNALACRRRPQPSVEKKPSQVLLGGFVRPVLSGRC